MTARCVTRWGFRVRRSKSWRSGKWFSLVVAGFAISMAAPIGASAADLDGYIGPKDEYGSGYEDRRYADIYRRPAPPPAPWTEHAPYDRKYERPYGGPFNDRSPNDRFEGEYAHPDKYAFPPIPPEPIYRDDYYRHPPVTYPRRHAEAFPPEGRQGCVPKSVAREQLEAGGWRDIHDAELADSNTVRVKARRPEGRWFVIHVDRCTGEVVAAHPLGERSFGPYAYGGPGRPYYRSY
jgi:hypothetical protein